MPPLASPPHLALLTDLADQPKRGLYGELEIVVRDGHSALSLRVRTITVRAPQLHLADHREHLKRCLQRIPVCCRGLSPGDRLQRLRQLGRNDVCLLVLTTMGRGQNGDP
jgi:hypothetical protein